MVTIDNEKCIRCGLCASECPHRLIKKQDGLMSVSPEGCIFCGHCMCVCPQNAVVIPEYDMAEAEDVLSLQERIDPDVLLHSMKSRRSVRHFESTPVERGKLLQIVEAARYAPTGSNRQGVRFHLFTQDLHELTLTTIESLYGALEKRPAQIEPKLLNRYQHRWTEMHYEYTQQGVDRLFYHAPSVLVISGNDQIDGALAASYAELMTYTLGLGCVYVGFFKIAAVLEPIRKLLKLPPEQSVACCLAIGYPNVTYIRTAPRKKPAITFR